MMIVVGKMIFFGNIMTAFNNLKERWEYEVQERQFELHCPKRSLNSNMKAAWRLVWHYGSFTCKCYRGDE